jgi:hypothetical protein
MPLLLDLQTRVAGLLAADSAFAGVTILSDEKPDLVNAIAQEMGKQDFFVLITFAEGEAPEAQSAAPVFRERLIVRLFQHRLHTGHNPVTLLEKAITLIHNAPVKAGGAGSRRFTASSHRVLIDEEGLRIAELTVEATVQFG